MAVGWDLDVATERRLAFGHGDTAVVAPDYAFVRGRVASGALDAVKITGRERVPPRPPLHSRPMWLDINARRDLALGHGEFAIVAPDRVVFLDVRVAVVASDVVEIA